MHTGFLMVAGAKMSKSLNNFITVASLLKKYHPDVLRFLILSRHYRHPLDFKTELLSQSASALLNLKTFLTKLAALKNSKSAPAPSASVKSLLYQSPRAFSAALSADFNTPAALAALFSLLAEINRLLKSNSLSFSDASLISTFLRGHLVLLGFSGFKSETIPSAIRARLKKRDAFRAARNWRQSDRLRVQIVRLGYFLEDTPSGSVVVYNNFVRHD